MRLKSILLSSLTLSVFAISLAAVMPAIAKDVDEFGDNLSGKTTINFSDYPVVNAGDWRSHKAKIEWSIPVVVRDDFDGDYLAVFDKNYQKNFLSGHENGIVSNWSRNYLRIYAYDTIKVCGTFVCKVREETRETSSVSVKVGAQVFKLEGKDGNFKISEEMAYALKNAPSGDTKIKVMFEGQGIEVVNDIGKHTVSAWQKVYQDARTVAKS